MTARCWPAKTPPEAIPPDAEGVTWEEWRASVPWRDYDDPIRRRDLERARAEQQKQADEFIEIVKRGLRYCGYED